MNLISGNLENGTVTVGTQQYPGFDDAGKDGVGKVNVGVRPEHLILSDDGLPMTVKVVEPTGSETMVFLNYDGQDVVAVFRERHDFKPGQTIYLQPNTEHLHIFNSDNGKRL